MRPTKGQLEAARQRTLPDIIRRDLAVLFCGINPGLYSAAVGHHFARPGNRFWPALYAAGITPRQYRPEESRLLLERGCGLTDIVERATARAEELSIEELQAGRRRLELKVTRYRPRVLAILGLGAYRSAFARRRAEFGLQAESLSETAVWVLPNPSGLNAGHQLKDLAKAFRTLYEHATGLQSGAA